jgi:hypothetical protein
MAQAHYAAIDLRRVVMTSLSHFNQQAMRDPELREKVTPDSARRGNVPVTTDIPGFGRDAKDLIEAPILAQFPSGASQKQLADFLRELPKSFPMKGESAGPYLREASSFLLNHMCVEVLKAEAPPKFQIPVAAFRERAATMTEELWNIRYFDEAHRNAGKPDVLADRTAPTFLKAIEDAASRDHDGDTMAYYWVDADKRLKAELKSL